VKFRGLCSPKPRQARPVTCFAVPWILGTIWTQKVAARTRLDSLLTVTFCSKNRKAGRTNFLKIDMKILIKNLDSPQNFTYYRGVHDKCPIADKTDDKV